MTERELRNMCLDVIERGWPAYLTTVDDEGYPQTRAMFNLRNKEKFPELVPLFDSLENKFLILFTTNTSSSKITQIEKQSTASVYYHNPETWIGVMLGGDIEIVKDKGMKKKLWHENWIKYYPKGYDDPDHTILRLQPKIAKGWTGSRTFKIDLGELP